MKRLAEVLDREGDQELLLGISAFSATAYQRNSNEIGVGPPPATTFIKTLQLRIEIRVAQLRSS